MCLLKVGKPEAAVEQCEAGLALPGVIMETGMQAKLLARQMEGLLDADTATNSGEATAVYREARNLGLLELKGKAGASMLAKFDSLVARLPEPVPDEPKVERTAPLKELIDKKKLYNVAVRMCRYKVVGDKTQQPSNRVMRIVSDHAHGLPTRSVQ